MPALSPTSARQGGLRRLLRRVWHRYIDGRDDVLVFEGMLSAAADDRPDGITMRQATDDDVDALGLLTASASTRRIPRLLADGQGWLHVARHETRLVGYRCAMRRFTGPGWLSGVIRLAADQVYVDHIFVHPDYRRHNIGHRLSARQNADLLAAGIRRYVAVIRTANEPAIRLTLLRGGRPTLHVDSRRRLFAHRRTVSPAMPTAIRQLVEAADAAGRVPDPCNDQSFLLHRDGGRS